MLLQFPTKRLNHGRASAEAGTRRSCILASASYVTPGIAAASAPAITKSQYSTGIERLRFCSPTVDAPLPITRPKAALPPKASMSSAMVEGESVIAPNVYRISVDRVNRITVENPWHDGDMGDSNDRLKAARLRRFPGSKASAIAKQFGWKVSTYLSHENGQTPVPNDAAHRYARPYKASPGWILTGEGKMDAQNLVKLMGSIGAGGDVDPDYEQVPPEGFDEIELPLPVGIDAIALEVKGASMQPKFDDGDIVVCSVGPRNPADFVGKLVAVRTSKGKRYLKKLRAGSKQGLYSLHSFNDDPIEDVKLAWIGEVLAIIPGYRVVSTMKRAAG